MTAAERWAALARARARHYKPASPLVERIAAYSALPTFGRHLAADAAAASPPPKSGRRDTSARHAVRPQEGRRHGG